MPSLVPKHPWQWLRYLIRAGVEVLDVVIVIVTLGWVCPTFGKTFDAYCMRLRKAREQAHKETTPAAFGTCGCGRMWRSFYSHSRQMYYRTCEGCGAEVRSRSRYDIPAMWTDLMEKKKALYAARHQ